MAKRILRTKIRNSDHKPEHRPNRRLSVERLEARRMLAGKIILGGQTGFLDQPYIDVELRSGDTILGPTGSGFDIYPYRRMLLDTGANSILFANDAVLDLEANG